MSEFKTVMDLGNGSSVRGAYGLFSPADKARLDWVWQARGTSTVDVDLSFAGDVEGYIRKDIDGNQIAYITVSGLADMQAALDDLRQELADLKDTDPEIEPLDPAEIEARLNDFEASLDAVARDQKEYLRFADYSTVDGSIVFTDGFGVDVFTLGGSDYETIGG